MKSFDISPDDRRWTFYDVLLDDVTFEWPDPFGDDDEQRAKGDCIQYLDQIFNGRYRIKSFQKREGEK